MEVAASLTSSAGVDRMYREVRDLCGYPRWLDLVRSAVSADEAEGDPGPAWIVELGAKVGPFERSKRLRMVRARDVPSVAVRFVRRELDERRHSPWVLDATIAPSEPGSRLQMTLRYDGTLFGPVLEPLLRREIEAAKPRLSALVAQPE